MTSTISESKKQFTTITVSKPSTHVSLIEMSSPPVNSLGWELRSDLIQALAEIDRDKETRAVVLTGYDKSFTAGADLRQESELDGRKEQQEYSEHFNRLLEGVENFRTPIIAAINGHTVGGGLEFALCCDIRIAAPEAKFVAAGVNIGLIASFWRLPNIVGHGVAKEILLTGRKVTADEALRWGLVTEIHERETLVSAAVEKAELIAGKAPLSVELTKSCVNRSINTSKEDARVLQREAFTEMLNSNDHREAVAAFFDKRRPVYTRT